MNEQKRNAIKAIIRRIEDDGTDADVADELDNLSNEGQEHVLGEAADDWTKILDLKEELDAAVAAIILKLGTASL